MVEIINGIQQIGIGVLDVKKVFNWYRKHLNFDILLFEDEAVASLMTKYTNGKAERREAYLSLNMTGGGGLEIWQFKDRNPTAAVNPIQFGDLGIYAMKIRCKDLTDMHSYLKDLKVSHLSEINKSYCSHFYFTDPFGNMVQMVEDHYVFCKESSRNGGVQGAVIGVSHMETSLQFYSTILGYSVVKYDAIETADEISKSKFRRVVISQERKLVGGFGDLLGPTQLELIQLLDKTPVKIFENRLWGDLGYIHLCFDVSGMSAIREKAKQNGHAFTVDSANSFDMGNAAGHFSYIEDPDGTLIELVETHKVPILKSLGVYLNLKRRNPNKTLPKWLVKSLSFQRVKKDR
ncbi:catechol 2,3-dioxygenase-like lactoylglutathione lyase family enzyme [Maribacter spongiicola]|uniref:Catechol 2,3-dioxygenase-like lactoylglutathione lyase family enzyme n=1 Tax=Maribacter spongiicola TaxID=1206753 RepID=A0A4R7K9F3_9FLAO|nr:VOC family protein [Maribacter spongiicola]TDT50710.1 catechol 2,3-dioxygenase-like lactoylglutathione lyase family enzyme [Maribacter spongiicola]